MAKKQKKGWGIDLDFDLAPDIAESWAVQGFDVEEFFVPDVDASAFHVEAGVSAGLLSLCRFASFCLRMMNMAEVQAKWAGLVLRRMLGRVLGMGYRVSLMM